MNAKHIKSILKYQTKIIELWMQKLERGWDKGGDVAKDTNLYHQCEVLLHEIDAVIDDFNSDSIRWTPDEGSRLVLLLNQFGELWAVKGLAANEASSFILALKNTLCEQLTNMLDNKHQALATEMNFVNLFFDRILVMCHEAFSESKSKLIKQQSMALLELSSPVVKLWEQLLLVPLIGVIDTSRAKQITESLLTTIADKQALIAIMDLTGVPVFDTAVAGHLMKTVKAASMLGCKVIMTGISPEGALVLTKLGMDFSEVTTRGNLYLGVQEGLKRLGFRIIKEEPTHEL